MAFEVGLLLEQFDLLERQIEAADAHVATLLDGELARRLQTIPGVGPATAATLIAEIGDIDRFSTFDQLLAYAGVHPAERSSGRKGANPETAWRMSKACNAYLRTAASFAGPACRRWSPGGSCLDATSRGTTRRHTGPGTASIARHRRTSVRNSGANAGDRALDGQRVAPARTGWPHGAGSRVRERGPAPLSPYGPKARCRKAAI
jgi:hypothetical protein